MAHYDSPSQLPGRYREQVRQLDLARRAITDRSDRAALQSIVDTRATELSEAAWEVHQTRDAVSVTWSPHRPSLRVELPLRAWGVNRERSEHWAAHRRRTREARDFAELALCDKKIPAFSERVEVEWTTYGTRLDPGSDYPLVKAIVDALVTLGVLEQDTSQQIGRMIAHAPHAELPERVVLEIRPFRDAVE